MAVLYRVANWNEHFENNRTRELKTLTFVPIPNKLDGDGYTELIDHPAGISHYGAWVTIVHVASRCDPRGTLLRAGKKPHDSTSLARMTRVPSMVYEEVIPRLISIGWLEAVNDDCEKTCEESHDAAGIPHGGATIPHDPALNGREGKEGNRRERPQAARSVFSPPSVEEVRQYCQTRDNGVDPETFVNFYASKGWLIGKTKMKDWQAAVHTWEKRSPKVTPVSRVATAEDCANWNPTDGGPALA
jgi:hypothetical protein